MKPTNLAGRLRNLERDISGSKPLHAIFEAISNACYSIEDRVSEIGDGSIELILHRKPNNSQRQQSLKGIEKSLGISDIEIIDNGVGFINARYEAFDECDTLFNHARDGRGVGRLVYLLAFDRAEIESHVRVKSQWVCRRFKFGLKIPNYVSRLSESASDIKTPRTRVKLCGLLNPDDSIFPKSAAVMADKIIAHWMHRFVRRTVPKLVVKESDSKSGIDLQDRFRTSFLIDSHSETVSIKNETFSVEHVRLRPSKAGRNQILLCVEGRVVEEIDCRGPLCVRRLTEPKSGEDFVYKAYVTGKFLVDSMDSLRGRFNIARTPKELGGVGKDELITYRDIQNNVESAARKNLRTVLNPLDKLAWRRVEHLVATSAPQYRYLLSRHKKRILERVTADMPDDRIDAVLHRLDLLVAGKLREQAGQIKKSFSTGNYATIHDKFSKFVVNENRRGVDRLAAYVVHRRTILEMLALAINRRADGEAEAERVVHEVFAPTQMTSNQMSQEQLNLWIVDERLAFHRFLSSDKTLVKSVKAGPGTKKQKGARPDIAIFDNPASYSGDDGPYESVVIVEFKKPFRTSYPDEAPVEQIQRYIDDIVAQKALNPNTGRPIQLKTNYRFFVYIICDMTEGVLKNLKSHDFQPTADGEGHWKYLSNYRAYVEALPFEKLVRDAQKRNQAFFDNLGLSISNPN